MTPHDPLISIIVPVYHAGPYLADALESIAAQTYKRIEAIIVNDGSTDYDTGICRAYAASHPGTILIEQTNAGQSAARNAGLEVANGTYVVFMDADDVMSPEFCRRMLQLIRDTSADIVAAAHIDFNTAKPRWKPTVRKQIEMTGVAALEDMLYQKHITSAPWGKIFRRQAIGAHRFRPGIIYEDLEWLSRVLPDSGLVVWCDAALYGYRRHSASALGHFTPQRMDVLTVTGEISTRVAKDFPALQAAADDRRMSASFNILTLLVKNGHGSTLKADECWQTICRHRRASIRNPRVRIKNKAGAIISYGGRRMFNLLAKLMR